MIGGVNKVENISIERIFQLSTMLGFLVIVIILICTI